MKEQINPPALTDLTSAVRAAMLRWLEQAVIGLNLCPFAKAVHVKGQIHWVVSAATSRAPALDDLKRELLALASAQADQRDTTLLVLPLCLGDFLAFNDFLQAADRLLVKLRLDGVLQIASFHPLYEFADTPPGDITHFTNRAPFPTLHLLREASVARAVLAFPQAELIVDKNRQTLLHLGLPGWVALDVGADSAPDAGRHGGN